MRNRLKPDKNSAVLLAAVLFALIAGGGALFYQQESSLGVVTAQLKDKEKQRDESARLASRLAEMEVRFKEDTDRLRFLEASLPSMAYVPTLLKQIEQLGKDTQNVVRGVRPEMAPPTPVRAAVRRTDPEAQDSDAPKEEKPKAPEPYDRLTIQVALTGRYQSYQNFLQRLTQFPKIVAVDRVTLRPRLDASQPTASPQLDVDMQLTAFILKEGAAAAGTAAPASGSTPTQAALSSPTFGSAPGAALTPAPAGAKVARGTTGGPVARGVGA
jgi:Tfp pilus assembly protein PilO